MLEKALLRFIRNSKGGGYKWQHLEPWLALIRITNYLQWEWGYIWGQLRTELVDCCYTQYGLPGTLPCRCWAETQRSPTTRVYSTVTTEAIKLQQLKTVCKSYITDRLNWYLYINTCLNFKCIITKNLILTSRISLVAKPTSHWIKLKMTAGCWRITFAV